jgi:hypothetical protein
MEAENTPATPEPELDRRDILAQQFEAAEQGEDVAPVRDEAGRFAPKAKEEPVEAVEPVEDPIWMKPPSSWKKDYHEVWMSADPKMREYAWQREEQMKRALSHCYQRRNLPMRCKKR